MRYATRAKIFLTAIILALVAASIAYLVERPGLKRSSSPVKQVKLDQAEVVIDGFRFAKNDSEKVSWELVAKKAEVKKDKGTANLQDLEAVFNGPDGLVLTLKADEGVFDSGTRAVKLTKKDRDITITSNNGYKMSVKDIRWDDGKKELRTDNRVTVTGRDIKIDGKGMVARSDLQEIRITNGVRTVFSPAR